MKQNTFLSGGGLQRWPVDIDNRTVRLSQFITEGQKAPLDQTSQTAPWFSPFTTSQAQAYC